MLVEVTQENINQAVVSDNICPIELAMQENGFGNVRVSIWMISCNQQPDSLRFHIRPDFSVVQWIYDFDCGQSVSPIQIEINKEGQYATLVE